MRKIALVVLLLLVTATAVRSGDGEVRFDDFLLLAAAFGDDT